MDRKRTAPDRVGSTFPEAVGSRSSTAPTVTPEKAKRHRSNDGEVTADTVMGFPKYRKETNGEIMTQHYDFVQWARKKKAEGEVYGRLADFVEWVESPEGQELELEGQGKEQFTYGKHKGKTFSQIAASDPEYHERYLAALESKGKQPDEMLARYASWYEKARGTGNGPAKNLALEREGQEQFTYGRHKGKTFCQIADSDPEYHVRFMAVLERKGEQPDEMLSRYASWFEKARGSKTAGSTGRTSASHSAISGNERFGFGQHKGETFRQVCQEDPSYHLRYKSMRPEPHPVMDRYILYFAEHGDAHAAHEGEMDTLAFHAGIVRPCWNEI